MRFIQFFSFCFRAVIIDGRRSNMKHNRKTILITIAIIICLALCGIGLYFHEKPAQQPSSQQSSAPSVVSEVIEENHGPEYAAYYRDIYNANLALNPDYTGTVFFESNLVNQPFVQGADNGVYLRKNWITGEYDEGGANFMDYENTLDDPNIIIYGHYAYPSYDPTRTLRFTPLAQLLNAENYEANKTVYLLLENEIREYVIAAVYYAELDYIGGSYYSKAELQYNLVSFSDDYFPVYHDAVKARQLYDTGIDFTNTDRLLTLQTCVENRPDLRQVMVCKQMNTYPLDDNCTFEIRDMTSSEK